MQLNQTDQQSQQLMIDKINLLGTALSSLGDGLQTIAGILQFQLTQGDNDEQQQDPNQIQKMQAQIDKLQAELEKLKNNS